MELFYRVQHPRLDESTKPRLDSNRDKCNETLLPHDPIVLKCVFEQVKRFICPLHAQVQQYGTQTHSEHCEQVLVTADNVFILIFFFSFRFFFLSLCVLITQSVSINYQVCVISLLANAIQNKIHYDLITCTVQHRLSVSLCALCTQCFNFN